jgi:DNA (cytosine-5)-methyltransferase 1
VTRPTLLDVCCCAGLASDGYATRFDVTGVDIVTQPDYPYPFIKRDLLHALVDVDLVGRFDAVHVSPPCQLNTRAKHLRAAQGGRSRYDPPDLALFDVVTDYLAPTLEILRRLWSDKPWVVENVPGAPGMAGAVTLCGSAFGLQVQRHRLFLSNVPLTPIRCRHDTFDPDPITGKPRPWGVWHTPGDSLPNGGRTALDAEHGAAVMGSRVVPWDRLKEGLPPAYTRHVAADLIRALTPATRPQQSPSTRNGTGPGGGPDS